MESPQMRHECGLGMKSRAEFRQKILTLVFQKRNAPILLIRKTDEVLQLRYQPKLRKS